MNNLSLGKELDVGFSIFDKYHHNPTFGKVNLKTPLYPPISREKWDYGRGNV